MQGKIAPEFDSKFADVNHIFNSPDAWSTADLPVFFIFVEYRLSLDEIRFVLAKLVHAFDTGKYCTHKYGVRRDPINEIINVSHDHKRIEQQSNIIISKFLDCKKYHPHLYNDKYITV